MPLQSREYRLGVSEATSNLVRSTSSAPAPGPRQVLIQVGAASLNYRDLLTAMDIGSSRKDLIPMSDGAGTVVALGAGASRWREGERVSPNFFPDWIGGAFSMAYLGKALGGGMTDGVLSEYIVADEDSLVRVPDHLTLAEAATLPCAGLTAWHALF